MGVDVRTDIKRCDRDGSFVFNVYLMNRYKPSLCATAIKIQCSPGDVLAVLKRHNYMVSSTYDNIFFSLKSLGNDNGDVGLCSFNWELRSFSPGQWRSVAPNVPPASITLPGRSRVGKTDIRHVFGSQRHNTW